MISTLLLLFIFVACRGDVAVTPPAQPQVLCGELPSKIFSCIGNPSVHSTEAAQKCKAASNSCDRMTCIFIESGWLSGATVNKAKVIEHFEQYSAEHPEWTLAVQHTKAACLSLDLPAQGYHLNCPAYDIMMCSLASFIKNAQPSQWSASQQCEYSRRFAASCPVCPAECFATTIPIGSCHACYALPRSP